ncbi:autotransporter outer membrane beta-barrel domain-containing protein [Citrobacter amalonaticus]
MKKGLHFRLTAIASLVICSSVYGIEYTNTVDLSDSNQALLPGDSVNISESANAQNAVHANTSSLNIGASGRIDISMTTSRTNSRGFDALNSSGNNLGTGTHISLKSTDSSVCTEPSGCAAIGINMSHSDLVSDQILIDVDSATNAIGVNLTAGSSATLTNGPILSVDAPDVASGVYIKDAHLTTSGMQISSKGNIANGMLITGGNGVTDMGTGSVIIIEAGNTGSSGGSGVGLSGYKNTFQADRLSVKASGTGVRGIKMDAASEESALTLTNSAISTAGENSLGIYFSNTAKGSLSADWLTVQVSGGNARGIEAENGNLDLSNSTITSMQDVGVLAVSDGTSAPVISLDNSSVTAELTGVDATGIGALVNLKDSFITSHADSALKVENGGEVSAENSSLKGANGISVATAGQVNFTGNTRIDAGTGPALSSVDVGSQITGTGSALINGNIIAQNGGSISLELGDDSIISGQVTTGYDSHADISLSGNSVWFSQGDSEVSNLTLDNSALYIGGITSLFTAQTVTVKGNYDGNNGHIYFNGVLGSDISDIDRLIVKGDTSGHTRVSVTNIGGTGSQTVNGIELIHVDGLSAGEFTQESRIVAGAYDYTLVRGKNENQNHWYLVNNGVTPEPVPEPEPEPAPYVRPEAGSYLANNHAANTMFITRLHDRLGDTQYTDMLTGEQKVTSMWMRHVGGHTRVKDDSGQLKTQANRYVLQLGGDIAQWSMDGLDRWHLGIMTGYANGKSNSRSSVTDYRSNGQINGYSVGVYGTWYANETDRTGTYVDSWVLYNWFSNKVSGQGLATEKYDSDGITASLEGGYTFLLGEGRNGRDTYWLQPKAQLTWMDVQADRHTETNGTRVKDTTNGNLQTRLGVKTFIKGHNKMDEDKEREFQPFVEANWIYNSAKTQVKMDDVTREMAGTRNIGELKAGVEGQLNKNLQLWGNVAQQLGDKGYSDTQGMLGIKYMF